MSSTQLEDNKFHLGRNLGERIRFPLAPTDVIEYGVNIVRMFEAFKVISVFTKKNQFHKVTLTYH